LASRLLLWLLGEIDDVGVGAAAVGIATVLVPWHVLLLVKLLLNVF
jgi:hypothetical protein